MSRIIHNPVEIAAFLPENTRQSLPYLFNQFTGIVNGLLLRDELHSQGLEWAQFLSCDKRPLFNLKNDPTSGGAGIHATKEVAISKALSESVERYCIAYGRTDSSTTIKELEEPNRRLLADNGILAGLGSKGWEQAIDFIKMNNIFDQQSYLWPSRKIFVPYPEPRTMYACTTTGTSASPSATTDDLIVHALLETIERDTLMTHHYLRLKPDEIYLNSVTEEPVAKLVKNIKRHWQLKIFRLSNECNVFTYVVLVFRNTIGGMRYGIGASTSLKDVEALQKALHEAVMTYKFVKYIKSMQQTDIRKVYFLHEHFLYYQGEKFNTLLKGFTGGNRVPFKEHSLGQQALFKQMQAGGHNTLLYRDITTADIARYTPYRVMRVVVPTFLDLSLGYGSITKDNPRLVKVRQLRHLDARVFNPLPHPMP